MTGRDSQVDPRNEAVRLSSFLLHIEHWQEENPGKDPFVILTIGAIRQPVRGGVKDSKVVENAIELEWLDVDTLPVQEPRIELAERLGA